MKLNTFIKMDLNLFIYLFDFMGMYVYHMHARTCGGQTRTSDPLELELQVAMWGLKTKPVSSATAVSLLNC